MIWLKEWKGLDRLKNRIYNNKPQQPSNFDITDLASIAQGPSYNEPKRYLCEFCDNIALIEKKDDITYLGSGNRRYICPRCGNISDVIKDGLSRIKSSEELHTIVGGDNMLESTITPQIEMIENNKTLNKPKGTLFLRDTNNIDSYDPEPREEETLRSQGFKILKKTIKRADGRIISVTYEEEDEQRPPIQS